MNEAAAAHCDCFVATQTVVATSPALLLIPTPVVVAVSIVAREVIISEWTSEGQVHLLGIDNNNSVVGAAETFENGSVLLYPASHARVRR